MPSDRDIRARKRDTMSVNIGALRAATIAAAIACLGEHEIGNTNRGPLPDEALRFCNEEVGQAWCAAFACLMLHRAGVKSSPRNASSSGLVAWGAEHGAAVEFPAFGDLGMIKGGDTGHHHTVIVLGGASDALHCIEGNENNQVMETFHRTLDEMDCINPYKLEV